MATKGSEKPAAELKQEETKYQISKLREKSMQLFGITTSTFDGAFYGVADQRMSITEARSRIDKWLGRKE